MDSYEIIKTLLSGFFGALFMYLISEFKEQRARAKLKFKSEILRYYYEKSVRVGLIVEYVKGKLPVSNATSYLTIYVEKNKNKINTIPRTILPEKRYYACALNCYLCKNSQYLSSYDKAEVLTEVLPWAVPISVGKGLNGLEYHHLAYIPTNGSSKLLLFDLYRCIKDDKEFYLIKVHSEYGCDLYPRICLKLPLKQLEEMDAIIFEVFATGENVREEARVSLRIEYDRASGDYVLVYEDKKYFFNEILEGRKVEFRPKVESISSP